MGLERIRPNVQYSSDWRWVLRATILSTMGIVLTLLLGGLIESHIHALGFLKQDNALTALPDYIQGFIAYIVVTFLVYWWHRLRHHNDLLWAMFHQIHHSTYRLQAFTAFYAHPTDFLSNFVIMSLVSYVLLGYGLDAAAWASFWVGVFDLWEHTNIKTPHWLGYFIVRPEMHRVHHEKDQHRNNYGFPLWDMIFGTYENSMRSVDCGFSEDKERQILSMILFRNVDR